MRRRCYHVGGHCQRKEVVVSRGEREIGGAFRFPMLCVRQAAPTRSSTTPNRTHANDYLVRRRMKIPHC
ncbi:hypothetical protein ACLK1T_13250 [Escherichia coli]